MTTRCPKPATKKFNFSPILQTPKKGERSEATLKEARQLAALGPLDAAIHQISDLVTSRRSERVAALKATPRDQEASEEAKQRMIQKERDRVDGE